MKTTAARALLALAFLAAVPFAPCAEDEGVDENALIRAQVFVDQGDLRRGLTSLVAIMRESKDEDLRNAARDELTSLGLSAQEIFTLDPAKGKPDDLNGLIERISKYQSHKRRVALDHEYAMQILRDALVVRFDGDDVQADLRVKDAAKSAEILVKLALDDKGADVARDAQDFLEGVGVAGATIDVVKKATAEDTLPDAVVRNMKAAALFMRLEDYRGWRENLEMDDDQILKQRLAKEYGTKIFAYLKKNHGTDETFLHHEDLVKYWGGVKPDEPKAKPVAPEAPPAAQKTTPEQKSGEEKEPKF